MTAKVWATGGVVAEILKIDWDMRRRLQNTMMKYTGKGRRIPHAERLVLAGTITVAAPRRSLPWDKSR